ncbi:MAG: DMT family transporter [Sphaerochaetaceae bacterium]|nr:DMT family transporter [Sphaerochaetaceae bacterium]
MLFIIISILIGCGISVMISVNGELSAQAGQILALLIIYTVGLTGSSFLLLFSKRKVGERGKRPPLYYFITGTLGLVIVALNNAAFRAGGVVLVLSGMLAGQTLVAFLFDLSCANKRSRLATDLIALLLIAAGVTAVGFAYAIPVTAILLSVAPGIILMLQILMNSALGFYYGHMRTLQINYASGLTVIFLLALLLGILSATTRVTIMAIPLPLLLFGGLLGIVGMAGQNILVKHMSALALVLATYAGEFFMGIIIDTLLGKPFSLIHAAGLALVLGGLAVRNIPFRPSVEKFSGT